MTTTAPCNCDQAKSWEARALAAELEARKLRLSLRFAQQQLERLLDKVDVAIGESPVETVVGANGEPIGYTGELTPEDATLDSKSWRSLAGWLRARLAAKQGGA